MLLGEGGPDDTELGHAGPQRHPVRMLPAEPRAPPFEVVVCLQEPAQGVLKQALFLAARNAHGAFPARALPPRGPVASSLAGHIERALIALKEFPLSIEAGGVTGSILVARPALSRMLLMIGLHRLPGRLAQLEAEGLIEPGDQFAADRGRSPGTAR